MAGLADGIQNLVQAVEDQNAEMFSDHLFNYNQVNVLDNWKTELLLRIKNSMTLFGHAALKMMANVPV